jgi:hypothetical protein
VLNYLHTKGDTEPFRWRSGSADLDVYREILAEKILGDPTAIVADEEVFEEIDSDAEFYLTNTPDMV